MSQSTHSEDNLSLARAGWREADVYVSVATQSTESMCECIHTTVIALRALRADREHERLPAYYESVCAGHACVCHTYSLRGSIFLESCPSELDGDGLADWCIE